MTDDGRLVVHAWGFFDGDHPRLPDGISVSAERPYDAFVRVRSNIVVHGGNVTNLRFHRTLDGWFSGATWETPASKDGTADRMWHSIVREADQWNAPELTTPERG